MKPIKVLHMYADILDLYGDSGNMEILATAVRCGKSRLYATTTV